MVTHLCEPQNAKLKPVVNRIFNINIIIPVGRGEGVLFQLWIFDIIPKISLENILEKHTPF